MHVVLIDRGWLAPAVYGTYPTFAEAAAVGQKAVATGYAKTARPVAVNAPALLAQGIADAEAQAEVKEE